ncbi:aldo/keto reductase [Mangrovibacter yixingensis]|uniref:aldo/keto reductase n=1 Tax=Mangrovibacter yixingensis TaxID=1529639 RepID=UPI001CFA456F|nr:aldo/keto reductase [Mangrovibacter yixingensis]
MDKRMVVLPDNTVLPTIGLGTWYMGERNSDTAQEVRALQAGVDTGLRLIDTAEMYADGGAERVVGKAIAGRRDDVFLVSKVYPWNAGGQKAIEACEGSLKRLGTDHIDLWLLHWRGNIPLEETVRVMEHLVKQGKIKRWGVSNLDTSDMQELWNIQGGKACMVNQVLYHLASRGIEYDLLPWCNTHQIPVMAYSPLAQAGRLRRGLAQHSGLQKVAAELGITVMQLLLAWVIRQPGVMAIPKASSVEHVHQNAQAASIVLTKEQCELLDSFFAPPEHKMPLDMV